MTTKRQYGWNPDLPDIRDKHYSVLHQSEQVKQIALPPKVDNSAKLPKPFDQGQLGSCTANALAGAFAFIHQDFIASRLQIYYGERSLEHDIKTDGGAQIRDGVKVLNKTGAIPESEWPYDVSKFAVKPPAKDMTDVKKVVQYARLLNGTDFHNCLAAGFPFVIGFTVYDSFESDEVAHTGIVPMPKPDEQVLGGHAVLVYGYDDTDGTYLVRNSWGDAWGLQGNFKIPQSYFNDKNLADDAWTLRA